VTAGAAGTPGYFKAYSNTATDGTGIARCLIAYDAISDASGNIAFGSGITVGDQSQTSLTVPVYLSGCFATADLTGLTTGAITNLGGHLVSGTLADGILVF
jgi:hypothetical protein